MAQTKNPVPGKQSSIPYIVTKIPDLSLLGRNAIQTGNSCRQCSRTEKHRESSQEEGCRSQTSCNLKRSLCFPLARFSEFPDLFKAGYGMSERLWIRSEVQSWCGTSFSQGTTGPNFALRDDLVKDYEEDIAKGVWKPVQFNEYGTPVVPIRKAHTSGSLKPKLRSVVTIQWASTISWRIIVTHCHSLKNWCRNWEVDSGTPRLTWQMPTTRSSWHQKVNAD